MQRFIWKSWFWAKKIGHHNTPLFKWLHRGLFFLSLIVGLYYALKSSGSFKLKTRGMFTKKGIVFVNCTKHKIKCRTKKWWPVFCFFLCTRVGNIGCQSSGKSVGRCQQVLFKSLKCSAACCSTILPTFKKIGDTWRKDLWIIGCGGYKSEAVSR